jgi:hypothetical protein
LHYLDFKDNPIVISQPCTASRAAYLESLKDTSLADSFRAHTFLIEDPFDKWYNPARHVSKGSKIEKSYLLEMRNAFDMLASGEIPTWEVYVPS